MPARKKPVNTEEQGKLALLVVITAVLLILLVWYNRLQTRSLPKPPTYRTMPSNLQTP